ncbi:hypothetical protein AHiyo6_01130 [Arthrobacter sp. Hiyo6]|nr:hypothetical protein AHiyo6_01130 [Arthrobacter sp. Hiyo6]
MSTTSTPQEFELRETIEVTTPLTKKVIVLRGYINGRIKQALANVYLEDVRVEMGESTAKPTVSGATITKATNVAFEQLVLSVDGKTENVLDAILDLPEQDYEFVKEQVDLIKDALTDPKG